MRPTDAYFTDLTGALPSRLRRDVAREVRAALAGAMVRRDVTVPETGSTPRRYSVATRELLAATCPLAASLYRSPELLALVSSVAGEPLTPVPYEPEEFIATRLDRTGDTHGWHWDDYAYALVWILEAPPSDAGGALELVPHVAWNKAAPNVEAILSSHAVERHDIGAGTVYLLKTSTTMHRVAPLRRDATRVALCFSYASPSDLERPISHETVDRIYGLPTITANV